MWLESVNKKISEKGITIKQIAAESYLSEKTVKRILTGASKSPSMANVIAIVQCVGCSLDEVFEIFVGTQAVLGDENLVKLQQECDTYKEQLNIANQEILDLKQKCTELEIDLRIAKKEIELKDQIIAVHDYYTKKNWGAKMEAILILLALVGIYFICTHFSEKTKAEGTFLDYKVKPYYDKIRAILTPYLNTEFAKKVLNSSYFDLKQISKDSENTGTAGYENSKEIVEKVSEHNYTYYFAYLYIFCYPPKSYRFLESDTETLAEETLRNYCKEKLTPLYDEIPKCFVEYFEKHSLLQFVKLKY